MTKEQGSESLNDLRRSQMPTRDEMLEKLTEEKIYAHGSSTARFYELFMDRTAGAVKTGAQIFNIWSGVWANCRSPLKDTPDLEEFDKTINKDFDHLVDVLVPDKAVAMDAKNERKNSRTRKFHRNYNTPS
jgi:hypothetical protein